MITSNYVEREKVSVIKNFRDEVQRGLETVVCDLDKIHAEYELDEDNYLKWYLIWFGERIEEDCQTRSRITISWENCFPIEDRWFVVEGLGQGSGATCKVALENLKKDQVQLEKDWKLAVKRTIKRIATFILGLIAQVVYTVRGNS